MPQVLTEPTAEAAELVQDEPIEWTPERLEALAYSEAERFSLKDPGRFVETLRCESLNFVDPAIQSGHYRNGVRENSWGVAQFNLPSGLKSEYGETITKEMAINPEQAIAAAAYNFSIGNAHHWSCY